MTSTTPLVPSLQVWVKEYIGLMKNPSSYHKLTDGSWDFDVFVDMCFSFWTLEPITSAHPHVRTTITSLVLGMACAVDTHLMRTACTAPGGAPSRQGPRLHLQLPPLHALPHVQARDRARAALRPSHSAGPVQHRGDYPSSNP